MNPKVAIVLGFLLAAFALWANDRFLFESIHVPSSSMRPTILPNERLFLNRWKGNSDLKRFDIVVAHVPGVPIRVVKRIVGLPGECVELRDKWRVAIDGREYSYQKSEDGCPECQIEDGTHLIQLRKDPRYDFSTRYGRRPLCLKNDEYYVLGDNRLASEDSRMFGPVKRDWIDGRVVWRWYSFDLAEKELRASRIGRME